MSKRRTSIGIARGCRSRTWTGREPSKRSKRRGNNSITVVRGRSVLVAFCLRFHGEMPPCTTGITTRADRGRDRSARSATTPSSGYDFFCTGTAAALVFPALYFPPRLIRSPGRSFAFSTFLAAFWLGHWRRPSLAT